ncbi:MAG: large conductance mechanosensitive channel protein MscL [Oscillospiraceae bacterium]|nr:large conductance mechanosensitive channel protein MscL [Oscillospiraceae bacterium]
MKKFFAEFKTFAIKGNMMDMAVGMIVGGAFTALVTSVVANIATPLLGILIGIDLKSLELVLPRLYGNAEEPNVLAIGVFLNNLISFVVVALTVFLFVKAINKFRKKQEDPPPPEPSKEEVLLTEIRDILRDMRN